MGGDPLAVSLDQPGAAPPPPPPGEVEGQQRTKVNRLSATAGDAEETRRILVEKRRMTAPVGGDFAPEVKTDNAAWGGDMASSQRAAFLAGVRVLDSTSVERTAAGSSFGGASVPNSTRESSSSEGRDRNLHRESKEHESCRVNGRGGDGVIANVAAERERHICHEDADESNNRSINTGNSRNGNNGGATSAPPLSSSSRQLTPIAPLRLNGGNASDANDNNTNSCNEKHVGSAAAQVAPSAYSLLSPMGRGSSLRQCSRSQGEASQSTRRVIGEDSQLPAACTTSLENRFLTQPGEYQLTMPQVLTVLPPKLEQEENSARQEHSTRASLTTPVQRQRTGLEASLLEAQQVKRVYPLPAAVSVEGTAPPTRLLDYERDEDMVSTNSPAAVRANSFLNVVAGGPLISRPLDSDQSLRRRQPTSTTSGQPMATTSDGQSSSPPLRRIASIKGLPALLQNGPKEVAVDAYGLEPQGRTLSQGAMPSVSAPDSFPRRGGLPQDGDLLLPRSASKVVDPANSDSFPCGSPFRENVLANGAHAVRAFSGGPEDSIGASVTISLHESGTEDDEAPEGGPEERGMRGGRQELTSEQQWLQVPALFCLVFNLIRLHEAGVYQLEGEREREVNEMLEDPHTTVAPHQASFSSSDSLQHVYRQLSHTFYEVNGVLLNPYLTSWSDANLRRSVVQVARDWEVSGPRSQDFGASSLRLLDIVSTDRTGKVTPTLLCRVWGFIGTYRLSPRFICGMLVTAFALLVVLGFLVSLGSDYLVARVVLTVVMALAVLVLAGAGALLFSHNAVADKVRDFYFLGMLNDVAYVMRDLDVNVGEYENEDEDEALNSVVQRTSATVSATRISWHESLAHDATPLQLGENAAQEECSIASGGIARHPSFLVAEAASNTSVPDPRRLAFAGGGLARENYGVGGGDSPGTQSLGDGRGGTSRHNHLRQPQQGQHGCLDGGQLSGDRRHDLPAPRPEEAMKEMMVCKTIDLDAQAAQPPAVKNAGPFPLGLNMATPQQASPSSGGAASITPTSSASPAQLPLSLRVMRDGLTNRGLDEVAITALVYCRSNTLTVDMFDMLWSCNFLILQRNTLEALDAAFHHGLGRFKVFLLHVPDLDEAQLRTALAWSQRERRAVFFFASLPGAMPPEVPYAFRLKLPLTAREVETIQLSGIGVDEEINISSVLRLPRQFKMPQYTLGRRLGGGAFGNVFEVEMESMGACCAVKRMYLRGDREKGAHGDDSQLKEIAREVEIMSSLSHPNIVRYFFCERDGNCVSIFMELCSGGSLSELIVSGGLRRAEVIKRVLHDIISAVAYLHDKHILHRDLKPENVLFCGGCAKVSDFGTAVFKHGDLTNVKGTVAYMAPEVLLGETYDKACDVWSFGCIAADALSVPLVNRALGLPEMCELYRRMPLDATLEFDCDEPTVRGFLELCLKRDPTKRSSVQELLKHPMLKEDNAAVHRWLVTCAERRGGHQADSMLHGCSDAQDGLRIGSASVVSLLSADVLGPRCSS
ncbi:putative protein kinase [Trypanosoma rangeli]|uniref:Protein kinase domain-containing protein n=1 Tax=Trypanosoma rangeli TaxID=5698 RepID=A0A422NFX8_TRYRA|nr:putative protein kinase [Trypanosoma rangeli]RNF04371.1 putative protein kinase [Trypanosoma rangeli]|eukprot:RNF04371.1 putative protein kinase [Trypanosoma rangeli]